MKQPFDHAVRLDSTCQSLVQNSGEGQVHKDCAKAHWQKQGWFEALFDRQPDQGDSHREHYDLLPGQC